MLTGNKGEWSEVYTLLKVIADKRLFAGNSDLERIEDLFFPIIKVLRDESDQVYEYSYDSDLVVVKGGEEVFRVPIEEFQSNAVALLCSLNESRGTFPLPNIESFINRFNCRSIKASSSSKCDLKIVIHDQRIGTQSELGFSIKSQLGNASTLLNAGKTTNFIYKIEGIDLTDDQIEEINAIDSGSKIRDRVDKIDQYSGSLKFVSTEKSMFGNNLTLIDSCLPQLLGELVRVFYSTKLSSTVDLVENIEESNPLNYDISGNHPFYSYKVKHFLTDIALGLMPAKEWNGVLDATGGCLVVKEDGDILCYHIYNRNEFEDYLYRNTKFETASSGRHDFGTVYRQDGKLYFKLNLQIRFLK